MAWRDTRTMRSRLALYLASVVVGVAAVVSLLSFGRTITTAIHASARQLLGADLVVCARRPFTTQLKTFLAGIPGESINEVRFSSMVLFPQSGGTRLVQVRAWDGEMPFYGRLVSFPENAVTALSQTTPHALVEEALLIQYDAHVGDQVKIGNTTFTIAGRLQKLPGESVFMSDLAPRIIISMTHVEGTGLLQFGSMAYYRRFFRYPSGYDSRALTARLERFRDDEGIWYDTVKTRQKSLGRRLENLFHFLNLVAVASLVLGGMGIAAAMQVYIRQKLPDVAVIRCLGGSVAQTFGVYLLQTMCLGLIGGIFGTVTGVAIQHALPYVVSDLIPLKLEIRIQWPVVALGTVIGLVTTTLAALTPLLAVRRVSPLMTIRANLEPPTTKDGARIVVYAATAAAVLIYSVLTAKTWTSGVAYACAMFGVIATLRLVAWMALRLLRSMVPDRLPFPLRQGLRNLYRPGNHSQILTTVLGAGTFLIMLLYFSQAQLLHQVKSSAFGNGPNMMLYGIQQDQLDGVRRMLDDLGMPVMQHAPIVTMRLQSIKGVDVAELRRHNKDLAAPERMPAWALNREYRSTYRRDLVESESMLRGELTTAHTDDSKAVSISIEHGIAKDLRVDIGDEIVFDVQGIPITTVIASVRRVDWYRIQPNFFMVFPPGVLEEAPQSEVVVTRAEDAAASAALQRAAVQQFPNISAIDLTLVLDTLTSMLDKISLAIEFMASFCVATGLLVLIASMSIHGAQRTRESALLRVLGASKQHISVILTTEFLFLAIVSANVGIVLAAIGSWALGRYVFETRFFFDVPAVFIANLIAVAIVLTTGFVGSRHLSRRSVVEILQDDSAHRA